MKDMTIYVATHRGPTSKGIYRLRMDMTHGTLSAPEPVNEAAHQLFLAAHPSNRFLYSVGETVDSAGARKGFVSAFAVAPGSGKLEMLNQLPSAGGEPCHLIVDKSGRNVLVANYGGGSVEVRPVGKDGRLGEPTSVVQHRDSDPNSTRKPHAHSVNLDASQRFAFVADLGLDKVFVYRFDAAKGKLTPNDPPAVTVAEGSGPRHFALHPGGRFAWVINEKANTVIAFALDADAGVLKVIQTISTLPDGYADKTYTAELKVHPSGRFLYGSNRGHDSIAGFAIDPATGTLTAIGRTPAGGKWPRNFEMDPTGNYLLSVNKNSDNIVVFRIDPDSGALTPTGVTAQVPGPSCAKFLP
jgi:6-phosphogluconolactonase